MELQDNGQYIITQDDVINNSELTAKDLFDVYGEQLDQHLINASRKVYTLMYSAAPNFYRKNNADYLNYLIQNDDDKQNAMRDAIIEYVRGAVYSGMDLRAYENDKMTHSHTVIDILKENELWVRAKLQYEDSDIE